MIMRSWPGDERGSNTSPVPASFGSGEDWSGWVQAKRARQLEAQCQLHTAECLPDAQVGRGRDERQRFGRLQSELLLKCAHHPLDRLASHGREIEVGAGR